MALFRNFDIDNYIDIEYDEQPTATIIPLNEVGATGSLTSGELFYTPPALNNTNTIYVAQSGDPGNDGTYEHPVPTLALAQSLCTSQKQNIMILDSETYNESVTFTGYVTSLWAAKGQKPTIIPKITSIENETAIVSPTTLISGVSAGNNSCAIPFVNNTALILAAKDESPSKTLYAQSVTQTGQVDIPLTTLTFSNAVSPTYSAYSPVSHTLLIITQLNQASTNYTGYVWVKAFDEGLNAKTAETLLLQSSTNSIYILDTYALSNGNFAIQWYYYNGSSYTNKYLTVITPTLQHVKTVTISTEVGYPYGFIYEHDNHIYTYISVTTTKIVKYTLDGEYVETISFQTPIYLPDPSPSTNHVQSCSDTRYAIYVSVTNKNLYLCKIDITTGNLIYVTNSLDSGNLATGIFDPRIQKLKDGLNLVIWRGLIDTTYTLKYVIINDNVTLMNNVTTLYSSTTQYVSGDVVGFDNGNYCLSYVNPTAKTCIYTIRNYDAKSFNVTIPATMGGLTLQHPGGSTLRSLVKVSSNLTANFCTFAKAEGSTAAAITGTGTVTLNNCLITTQGASATTIVANYCQLIGVYTKYALIATNSIHANHCDFVSCYGAASAPTVIITNSIVYRPAAAQLSATTYTYTNNCDTATPLAGEQYCVHSNPLYINDGIINPALQDLNLRMRILGYITDSDAAGIASDGYNAGSLLVTYDNVGFSYKKARLEKDRWGIKREIDIVGEVKLEKKDGSDATYKDALKEVVTIKWRAMTLDDFEKILDIIKAPKSRVRVYFNPITRPTEYYTYTIVYGKTPASVDDSIYFSSRYVKDVSLVLTRGIA